MEAHIAYSGRKFARPRYYANAHEKDEVEISPVAMPMHDARAAGATAEPARPPRSGWPHPSKHCSCVAP